MTDTVRYAEYYKIEVPNEPGEGTRVLSHLKEAGVNLLAFSGFPTTGGKAQLDFFPENAQAFCKAIEDLNLTPGVAKKAFLIEGRDRVGAAAEVLDRLSSKGINVIADQALCTGAGTWGMILWVNPSDYERANQILTS